MTDLDNNIKLENFNEREKNLISGPLEMGIS